MVYCLIAWSRVTLSNEKRVGWKSQQSLRCLFNQVPVIPLLGPAMYFFFSSLLSHLRQQKVKVDNETFRLHYKFTLIVCIACSLLVTGREYFGDPIDCIPPGEELLAPIIDTYCWIHSTFTLPESHHKEVGIDVAHPGVESYSEDKTRVYHKYYQWVCFALLLQGMCFYFPRYLWKNWESGRIRSLMQNLDDPILQGEEKRKQVSCLVDYFSQTLKSNQAYFAQFVFCEALNFINVLFQICFVDYFLNGSFSSYGLEVLRNPNSNPMGKVFPRMTKCTFHFYGSSGDVQKYDTLCILPLNVLNEKIYVLLWFWFMALACISAIGLVYRAAIITIPQLRTFVTSKTARNTEKHTVRAVTQSLDTADWFLLHQLSKNIDPLHFKEVMVQLALRLKSDRNGNGKPLLSSTSAHDSAKMESVLISQE